MTINIFFRATMLSAAIALAGCGNEPEMSQQDIQYISHVDQARFFQRQGELKASTIEARSAIELQPQRVTPYFVIINNLLTAGDAVNAERQLDQLLKNTDINELSQSEQNQAALIRAESNILQGETEDALSALDNIASPEPDLAREAANLRGLARLAAGQLDEAKAAYQQAVADHSSNVEAMVGLSRIAAAQGSESTSSEWLSKAEQADPENESLWLWKAELAQSQQRWQDAEQAYVKALETIGQYDVMTYRKYQTISSLVTVLREQGKSAEAFVYEEILAKSGPGTIKSNLEAASAAYNEGDLDGAARYLQEVLNQAPSHEQSALMLGMIRFRQGRTEEASRLLEPLVDVSDSDGVLKLLAATRISMRDPEGARSLLENLESKDTDPQTLALVGIASLAAGDTESGRRLISRSLELNPDNHNLRLRYAAFLMQSQNYVAAIDQASQIPTDATEAQQARLLVAEAHSRNGNPAQAQAVIEQWLAERPEDMQALLAMGNLAVNQGDSGRAREFFNLAEKAAPKAPAPQVALGNLARRENQLSTAVEHFKEAVRRDPDNRAAVQAVGTAMDRETLTSFMDGIYQQQPDALGPRLVLLETALINNDNPRADELTAGLLERQQPDEPSQAEPLVATVYEGIATQMAQRDRLDRAREILQRGRVLFPDSESIALKMAALEFQQGNSANARDILQEMKQRHPDSPAPYQVEANHYSRQGEHAQAAELLQLALEKRQSPDLALAHIQALTSAGQADAAGRALEAAAERYPNNASVLIRLAMHHQERGDREAAILHYEQAIALVPGNPVVLNNLAWLYSEKGDDRAAGLAKQAYQLAPENAAIADTYGWILFNSGERESSLTILRKAHELAPDSQEIAMHLVEVYRAVGMTDEARAIMAKFEARTNG